MMSMVTALASELVVLRERLDTVERLAERNGLLDRAEIDRFVPDAEAQGERDHQRKRLIDKIFASVRSALAAAARGEKRR